MYSIDICADMFRLIADQARKSNQRKLGLLLSDCIQVTCGFSVFYIEYADKVHQ